MRIRYTNYLKYFGPLKWIVMVGVLLASGCYQPPAAEQLKYDADAVQSIRQAIKSVDWDE